MFAKRNRYIRIKLLSPPNRIDGEWGGNNMATDVKYRSKLVAKKHFFTAGGRITNTFQAIGFLRINI